MFRKNPMMIAATLALTVASLGASAATCTDSKGHKYDCKVANKPASTPAPTLAKPQPAKPAVLPAPTLAKPAQPSLIAKQPANGAKIISTNGGGIVAQGGGNVKPQSGIVAQGGGNLRK